MDEYQVERDWILTNGLEINTPQPNHNVNG
jgi:hypothetical protein